MEPTEENTKFISFIIIKIMIILVADALSKQILTNLEVVSSEDIPVKFTAEDYITVEEPSFSYAIGDYLNESNDGIDNPTGTDPGPPNNSWVTSHPEYTEHSGKYHHIKDIIHIRNVIGSSPAATCCPIFDYLEGKYAYYDIATATTILGKMCSTYTNNYMSINELTCP